MTGYRPPPRPPLPDPPPRCILGGAEDLQAGGGRRRPYSWREGAGGGWPWIHHPGGWSGREDRRRHDPQAVRLAVRPGRPDRHHPHRLRAERHRRPLRDAVPRARRRPGPLPPHPRPRGRRAAGAARHPGRVRRDLPHRGQPAPPQHHDRRHLDGQGAPAAERGGVAHRRHVRRRRVPVRAHDRVRQGGRVAAGAGS